MSKLEQTGTIISYRLDQNQSDEVYYISLFKVTENQRYQQTLKRRQHKQAAKHTRLETLLA